MVAHLRTMSVDATTVATAGPWIVLDHIGVTPFNIGFGIRTDSGGPVTYRVEHTFDDLLNPLVTSARPFIHTDVSGATGSIDGNYAFPVRAARLVIASAASAGTVSMNLLQTGV